MGNIIYTMLRRLLTRVKRPSPDSDISSDSETEIGDENLSTSSKKLNNNETQLLSQRMSNNFFNTHFRNLTPLRKSFMASAENENNVNVENNVNNENNVNVENNVNNEMIPLKVNNEIRNRITKLNKHR